MKFLKRIASRLPVGWQQALKRALFHFQIRRGSFQTHEREYGLLPTLINPGDWVLDIGANVGHYTMKFADLVGSNGRVVAFEPVPETFELLAANTVRASRKNISLINAAVSDSGGLMGMDIPQFDSGLDNYYMARASAGSGLPALRVLKITIDSLALPHKVRLAKIDTEGNELLVLKGMINLLRRDHPFLIVEDNVPQVIAFLEENGYSTFKMEGSSNRVYWYGISVGKAATLAEGA
jgi:FkbM family methyltransferase